MRLDAKRKEDYQKQYSKFFDMKILKEDFEQMPMLSYIVSKFKSDIEEPSTEIQELFKQNIPILETLDNSFTKEQKELFKEYTDINAQIESLYKEKIFVLGYITGYRISSELNR